jgi:serine/threonine-protein kinase RsbW
MTANISATDVFTLTMVSDIKHVSPVAEAIHAFCLFATHSEVCSHDIQLAVVEALNNVILHAYNSQEGKEIVVECQMNTSFIHIDIIDYGIPMSSLPVATLPAFDAEGGRGWWIINACVDEYYYRVVECIERERLCKPSINSESFETISVKSSKNILTLVKHFK